MPAAASSRWALTVPACTAFQYSCVVPLGMTAMLIGSAAVRPANAARANREERRFLI
jgi:hypothetical protein